MNHELPPPAAVPAAREIADARRSTPRVDIAVAAGPAVTGWIALASGRHVVGRSRAVSVHVGDPLVEAHHLLVAVDARGRVDVTQLTGAVPVRRLRDGAGPPRGVVALQIGSSELWVRRHRRLAPIGTKVGDEGSFAGRPSGLGRRTVGPAPSTSNRPDDDLLPIPTPPEVPSPPMSTRLVGVAVTAATALVASTVSVDAVFLAFAVVGVIAAFAVFAAGMVSARRERHRARRAHQRSVDAFHSELSRRRARRRAAHVATHEFVGDVIARIDGHIEGWAPVWEQRCEGNGPLRATLGRGTVRWQPGVEVGGRDVVDPDLLRAIDHCSAMRDVPVPIHLASGGVVAVQGPDAHSAGLVRSLVIQLAVAVGPSDWRLVVLSQRPEAWRWCDLLPHGARGGAVVAIDPLDDGRRAVAGALDSVDIARRVLVVTDDPSLITARTGPLRRFLAAVPNASALVSVSSSSTVPPVCRSLLRIGSSGTAEWAHDGRDLDDTTDIVVHGISAERAAWAARRLARLVDPEDAHDAFDTREAGSIREIVEPNGGPRRLLSWE